MGKKLSKIFSFLSANRCYNRILQENNYRSVILPHKDSKDKIAALLYNIANSQSQPRINNLAEFYRKIYHNDSCMNSMQSFLNEIYPHKPLNFNSLFMGMKNQNAPSSPDNLENTDAKRYTVRYNRQSHAVVLLNLS